MNRENSEELEVLRTFGNSMLGVFSPGDKIFARKIDFSSPQAGDIIVFTQNNRKQRLVVHRIIKRNEDRILTHGDNNLLPDRPITRKNGDIYLVEKALRNGEPVYFSHGAQNAGFLSASEEKEACSKITANSQESIFLCAAKDICPISEITGIQGVPPSRHPIQSNVILQKQAGSCF